MTIDEVADAVLNLTRRVEVVGVEGMADTGHEGKFGRIACLPLDPDWVAVYLPGRDYPACFQPARLRLVGGDEKPFPASFEGCDLAAEIESCACPSDIRLDEIDDYVGLPDALAREVRDRLRGLEADLGRATRRVAVLEAEAVTRRAYVDNLEGRLWGPSAG